LTVITSIIETTEMLDINSYFKRPELNYLVYAKFFYVVPYRTFIQGRKLCRQ